MNKENATETIVNIELTRLNSFEDHPFAVRDDAAMQQTVESIREYGVLVPAGRCRFCDTAVEVV